MIIRQALSLTPSERGVVMRYCVMHNLRFETPAKRDKLGEDVKAWIGKKRVWGETRIASGQDEEGYQIHSLEIRFGISFTP